MKKYYVSLGLKEGASQDDIQAAFDRLSKELDPAKNNNEEFFVEEYEKVQKAYKALSNSSILATENGAKNNLMKKPVKINQPVENLKPSNDRNKKNNVLINWLKNNIKILSLGIILIVPLKLFIHYLFFSERCPSTSGYRLVGSPRTYCYEKPGVRRPLDYHTEVIFREELWIFGLSIFIIVFVIWFFNKGNKN